MRPSILLLTLLVPGVSAMAEEIPAASLEPIKTWIAQQALAHTLSADFVQTRRLRMLRDPVSRPGRFWFRAPGSFRWELGVPPETIALRGKDALFLLTTKTKKFTRQEISARAARGGFRDLPGMEFPMARDYPDFARRFEVRHVKVDGNLCTANILPLDQQARKYLEKIEIVFDTATGILSAFEIAFRDGSALRNEFSNVRVNREIDPATFDPDLTGYTEIRGKD